MNLIGLKFSLLGNKRKKFVWYKLEKSSGKRLFPSLFINPTLRYSTSPIHPSIYLKLYSYQLIVTMGKEKTHVNVVVIGHVDSVST